MANEIDEANIQAALDGLEADGLIERVDGLTLPEDERRRLLYGQLKDGQQLACEIEELEKQRRMVVGEYDSALSRLRERLEQVESAVTPLAESLLPGKAKHYDVPGVARVQFRDYQRDVRIADPDTFIEALGADERNELVEMRPKLKTTEAKAYAKAVIETEGGEILPGVEVVPERRMVTVKFEGVS